MSQEKLLSLKAAAEYLGISESRLKELADHGIIPAYRVAGVYLRFKKGQLVNFKDKMEAIQARYLRYQKIRETSSGEKYSLSDRARDFWYFYDFYIISAVIILVILFFIFRLNIK
jgi:excisionase family DNA binding protein